MKKIGNIVRIAGIVIVLSFVTPACKTVQKTQADNSEKKNSVVPGDKVRGFAVLPDSYQNEDTVIMRRNISNIILRLAEANYNIVFFFPGGSSDPLEIATEEAHKNRMKIYTVITFPVSSDAGRQQPLSVMKSMLRNEAHGLATKYDIDGLGIQISDHSQELIETMVAEAMLVKPYLVNFVVYSGEKEYQNAVSYMNNGIVDLVIAISDIRIPQPFPYIDIVKVPVNLKVIKPEQAACLDLSALFPGNKGGQIIELDMGKKSVITDSEGFIGFISPKADTIELRTQSDTLCLSTRNWYTPYKYSVQPDGTVKRKSPWIEFRRMPKDYTDVPEFDLLCKSDYPASVSINGDSVKQYRTGIFFKKVTLKEGENRIRASVYTKDSLSTFYEREFVYENIDRKRQAFPLWMDQKTVEPAGNMELLSDEIVRVSFNGSLGQEAFVLVTPGRTRVKCSREDHDDYSLYRADLYLDKLAAGKSYRIVPELVPAYGTKEHKVEMPYTLTVRPVRDFPLIRVKNEYSRLTYNLGSPRLGGPIRSELGPGVILKTNGMIGEYYRISLSRIECGYIHHDDVEVMPEGTVQPSYIITSMSCSPSDDADILSIPYPEPVPYEVIPEPDQKRIVITLFGVQTASTWITHMNNRKIIDRITWQQTTPETYQIFVNLKTACIWGYDLHPDGKRLVLSVKYPPSYDLASEKPLSGLTIAIEAGHGGSGVGASGLSGLPEKEINLDLSFRLGEICRSMGAEVIQVRESDIDISLPDKRDIAVRSGADMLISIHANAGGRGYLSVAGTSTYWHNPFWAPLAEAIYDRLLELDLKEFGVIGSFNYTVTRVSQMPSVLVEQAFMSHAGDEEKLADPQFRQLMAQKIYKGIIDYLKSMSEN